MSDSNYIRRRFTLTEEIDERLDELSNVLTAGNRSACIRLAIQELAQRQEEGHLRKEIQELKQAINSLETDSNQSGQPINEAWHHSEPLSENSPTVSRSRNPAQEDIQSHEVAHELYNHIRSKDKEKIALSELSDGIEYSLAAITDGLAELEDRDVVVQSSADNSIHYLIDDPSDQPETH